MTFSEWFTSQFPQSYNATATHQEMTKLRNSEIAGRKAAEELTHLRLCNAVRDAAHKAWIAGYEEGRQSIPINHNGTLKSNS